MKKKEDLSSNKNSIDEIDGKQAYQTLVDWVKTVPKAMQEIKDNGTEEDLKKYKLQIKLVLDKLKEIEKKLSR
tara:strand:+ start:39 stop:257 length:219 start_codon:yes stop_codon:yes gene_type:complete